MSVRELMWAGKIHRVEIPRCLEDAPARGQWTYAQMRAAGEGHATAMRGALAILYPGLGYSGTTTRPLPYGSVVSAHVPAVSYGVSDRSSPSVPHRTLTQTRRPPHTSPAGTGGVSGNGGHRTRPAQFATSNASSSPSPAVTVAHPPSASQPPRQNAIPRKAGWMGSAPTTA
jgi:hypothetical protein